MRAVFYLFLLIFLPTFLVAQLSANEQTMAGLAKELTTQLNGKKLKKVAVQRLTFNGDKFTPEGAWLADEMAFALQAAGPDFAIISREELEQKTADYAKRQAEKANTSSAGSNYEESSYEETYSEEEGYEETYSEEEGYEDPEAGTYEKSGGGEKSATGTTSKSGSKEQVAKKKKKKNTGLIVGGALLAAGAAALLTGNKKPTAGIRATITGTITERDNQLLATFRAVDRKGRVLAMVRGRFVR
ncbi:MAG: hypothetical protein AAF840_05810 [Bacteroidota bacterium]